MTQSDKLKKRFLSKPKDFSWIELRKLLCGLGYEETHAGKTSGSRVRFMVLKEYQLKQVYEALRERG
jgi:hypothetical protein